MAEGRVEVLLKVSQVNLARAEKRFDDREYDSAAFHASMAVEAAANALILRLGGDGAKNHRAITGLAAVTRRIRPDWLREDEFERLIDKGGEIQREVVYARYPLKVADRWLTPMEYYTPEKARTIIDNAKFIVDAIRRYLRRKTASR